MVNFHNPFLAAKTVLPKRKIDFGRTTRRWFSRSRSAILFAIEKGARKRSLRAAFRAMGRFSGLLYLLPPALDQEKQHDQETYTCDDLDNLRISHDCWPPF